MTSEQSSPQTFTFDHPELGSLTGIIAPENPNVVQFKAIPYATLPARFKQSILLESLDGISRDFTKPGFASPHTVGADEVAGGQFPGQPYPTPMDEYKSLILQINVPFSFLQPDSVREKLPVLLYIHGGGFVLGKIDLQHNTAYMVEQSILDNQPVIGASIQYRVGPLGFLYTSEGERNFGFYDQRNALLWIQKFVTGFGGAKENVTVFGESAGAMSICYHILAKAPETGPLFKRAVLMSGSIAPSMAPYTLPEADKVYENLLETLNIEERGETGLEKLRALDVQKIVEACSEIIKTGGQFSFVEDSNWFGHEESVTWDRLPELIGRCEWIDEIVLGTTGFEGSMFLPSVSILTPSNFSTALSAQLGSQNASSVLEAYNITPTMDQNLFYTAALRWIGDAVFDAPTHALARYLTTKTNKKVYRYIFDIRNPFPNHALYQTAHHWVDVYFVFKTYQFRYPTQFLKNVSTKHAQLWTDFANGKKPWSEYKYADGKEATIMVADDREGWVERTVAEDEKINEVSWKRVEVLWESWKVEGGKYFNPLKIEPLKKAKLV